MDTFLNELAEIYFTAPKNEKQKLKQIFSRAFRGAKKQVSIKCQHPYLEYQVHLRTLLCFGYIDNIHRRNGWNMLIPRDIKLLISIYYPDVFKAPIGINLGWGFVTNSTYDIFDIFDEDDIFDTNYNFNDVITTVDLSGFDQYQIPEAGNVTNFSSWRHTANDSINTSLDNISDDVIDFSPTKQNNLFDMFDIGGGTVKFMNGKTIGLKGLDLIKNGYHNTINIMTFAGGFDERNEGKTPQNYKNMQIVLSRKASMDDIFCNALDRINDLFTMETTKCEYNKYGVEEKHIIIRCIDYGFDKILNILKKFEKRYENVTVLIENTNKCVIFIIMATVMLTITVFVSN